MRRALIVAFAVMASVMLVVTPAAGAHTTVASIHTTDTDFNSATKLTNVSVSGSGTSASVDYASESANPFDDFESGDLAGYGGDTGTGAFTVQSTTAYDGSYALDATASTATNIISDTGPTIQQGDTETYYIKQGSSGDAGILIGTQNENDETGISGYEITTRPKSTNANDISFARWDSGTRTGLSASGELTGDEGQWWRVKVDWATDGTITATVYDASTGTKLASHSVTDTTYTSGGIGYKVYDGTNYFDAIPTDPNPGTYVSDSHAASNVQEGFTDLSVTETNATVTWEAYDGTSWIEITNATYTTSGNKTQALSGSYDSWRVNVTFDPQTTSASAQLHDEGVTATTHSPALDNTSASPSGGETLTESPTFKINGSDVDFGTAQGDTLTLDWYRNGNKLGSTTETANGTYSFTPSDSIGGNNTWHVTATDDSGHSVTSDTFKYESPAVLRIYNESRPSKLVDNATVEIRYHFAEDSDETALIETRNTTNGEVDMSGLPADRSFVVVANADGYLPRRIYVESLYDTQRIYLLSESKRTDTVHFALTDFSGDYPPGDSVLLIQRALNESWQTVHGDRFGATGQFPAQIRHNTRHRLVLLNTETGTRKVVGPFTPLADSKQEITVFSDGSIQLEDTGINVQVEPGLRRLDSKPDQNLTTTIRAEENNLKEWSVEVIHQNATTGMNTTLAQTSNLTDSGGVFSSSHNLTGKQGQIIVNVTYTTKAGATASEYTTYKITKIFENEYGLLPVLGSVKTSFPERHQNTVTALISIIMTVLVAGSVARIPGTSTEVIGLAAILPLAGFGVLGWIGYGPVFAGAAAWIGMSALKRGI